ncbi:glycosyltransferase family 4 protein [Cohnella lubricantis]|uniref:Glycosyltransferase family 4 protein n=1 Tax=Cohnella lubricantis TaxID=2163172 RepID=A0A841TFQ3_9BACL|nr:glycosyltransferase family 4 protein [Cohnella lubricantis]MBB6678925.1 glycosyltransferase family 4 protein [Cohnella lubricantis]MBP2120365.1 spore coat protein SA [Cohnella lubricantis]
MVKAAFVTPGAYPVPSPRGGSVERVVEKFVPLLAPRVDAVIYGRIGRRLPSIGTISGITCVRFRAGDKKQYVRRVIKRLAKTRPDLIEVENRPRLVRTFRRHFPKAQIWLHLHSNTFISKPYLAPRELPSCLAAADRVLVNSEYLKADVASRVPRAASKIGIVYPGVDPQRFAGWNPDAERAARGWQNRRIVLYVGRLIPLKGVHLLLEAMPAIIRRVPDALLVVVGGAYYGSNVKTAYVRKLHRLAKPLRHHVHFQPYVPHTEIPRWFAMAHAAAVPSVKREAFGLVNVEAMAAGLPVVASRVGGMTEIVQDGVTGYLIDPIRARTELADRLSLLLADEGLRAEMGRRGQERALQHFTWQATANRWLSELEAAMPNSANR